MKKKNETPTLQTKRRTPKASGFRMFHASTGNRKRRRKQKATTASAEDFDGEIPGVGVARSLFVILLIHVVAIGAIWYHKSNSDDGDLKGTTTTVAKTAPAAKPDLIPGGRHYFVERGDSYPNIAGRFGVDVGKLKEINNNAPITSGILINIPEAPVAQAPVEPVREPALVQPPAQPVQQTQPIQAAVIRPVERPMIQPNGREMRNGTNVGDLVAVGSEPAVSETQAVLIKPRSVPVNPPVVETPPARRTPPRAVVVREAAPAPAAKTHRVVKGDSLWRISKRYGVSQSALMRANGIKDASKIRLGAKLKIPN